MLSHPSERAFITQLARAYTNHLVEYTTLMKYLDNIIAFYNNIAIFKKGTAELDELQGLRIDTLRQN